jgi:hypothetical protein
LLIKCCSHRFQYRATEERKEKKRTFVLVGYSAFVTATLLSVLIFGGLMFHFRTLDCDQVG